MNKRITLEQIIITGIYLGHWIHLRNPKIDVYIYQIQNDYHLIDLVRTHIQLKIVQHFLIQIIGKGKRVLFVGNELYIRQTT